MKLQFTAFLFATLAILSCTPSTSRSEDFFLHTFERQRLSEVYGGTSDGRVLRVLDGYSDGKKFDGTGAVHIRGTGTLEMSARPGELATARLAATRTVVHGRLVAPATLLVGENP